MRTIAGAAWGLLPYGLALAYYLVTQSAGMFLIAALVSGVGFLVALMYCPSDELRPASLRLLPTLAIGGLLSLEAFTRQISC